MYLIYCTRKIPNLYNFIRKISDAKEQQTVLSLFSPRVSNAHLLSEKAEVFLVCHQAQHDQVGVEAVQTVPEVVPPVRLRLSRFPDIVHHLEHAPIQPRDTSEKKILK